MFLSFKKINNSDPSFLTDITVRGDSIMYVNSDVLENRRSGQNYLATRIEVYSFPNYQIFTPSTLDQVNSVLPPAVIDVTGGAGSGSSCYGDAGVLDIIYAEGVYPFLRANMIRNQTKSELEAFVFNPAHVIFAEDITFIDNKSKRSETGLLLVIREAQPRRIVVDLTLADLDAILEPVSVPL